MTERMKALFAAPENAWGGFLGMVRKELPEHEFVAHGGFELESLAGYDVLVPTMARVGRELLETADRLKLIQQCGSGIEGVDLAAARDMGIHVANVPTDISGNADSVAELGVYFMVGLSRDPRGMRKSLAARKMGEPQGRALPGRTVGFVGLGGIGRALARRLRPFGVRMIGIKRTGREEARGELGLEWVGGPDDLAELLGRSDFVVLCLPQSPDTAGMIGEKEFKMMKSDAYLINLSRGGLVNRAALRSALESGAIAGAGLDVFWEEPPDPADPIFELNVMATPHIGGSTDVSIQGILREAAENIRRVARGETPLHLKLP